MDFCSTLLLRRRRSPMSPRSPVSRCLDKKVRKCMFFKNENIKIAQRKISNIFELSPKWASTTLSKLEMNSPDPSKWEWHTKWHTVTHETDVDFETDHVDVLRFWTITSHTIPVFGCIWLQNIIKTHQNNQTASHREWHTKWHTSDTQSDTLSDPQLGLGNYRILVVFSVKTG